MSVGRHGRQVVISGRAMAILAVAAMALAFPGSPARGHHTLKQMEEALREREHYLQPVEKSAPSFTLKDADGRAVRLEDFRGRVVVLNFIFATCTDVCPLHSELIAKIQEKVNMLPVPVRELVQFITITTHPEFDTPKVLKAYGPARGLNPSNWLFLTSGPERPTETRELAERYGLKFTPVGNGQFVHGVVTHLIDQKGVLRARYHGLKFNPVNMMVHINALIDEFH